MSNKIAFDIGSANIRIHVKGRGLVVNDSIATAFDKKTKKLLCTGKEALAMEGKTHKEIQLIFPIENGVVSSYDVTARLIKYYLNKLCSLNIVRPQLVFAVPADWTTIDKNSLLDIALQSGARKVYVVPRGIAAGLGLGLPIYRADGVMIVDIGAQTTEISVLSLDGLAAYKTVKIGGDHINKQIIDGIYSKYRLHIGMKTAEWLKRRYVRASLEKPYIEEAYDIDIDYPDKVHVKGMNEISGLPDTILVDMTIINDLALPLLNKIADGVADTLARTSPELISDIYANGIYLIGGSSAIEGIDKFLSEQIGIRVELQNNCIDVVASGALKAIDNSICITGNWTKTSRNY